MCSRRPEHVLLPAAPIHYHECQEDIATGLGNADEQQEPPELFPQDTGNQCQGITDYGNPTEQQGPSAVAVIPPGRSRKHGRFHREPPTVSIALYRPTKPPIENRPGHIAHTRHGNQHANRDPIQQDQARQHGFRLGRQDRRRNKCAEKQAQTGNEPAHSGVIGELRVMQPYCQNQTSSHTPLSPALKMASISFWLFFELSSVKISSLPIRSPLATARAKASTCI